MFALSFKDEVMLMDSFLPTMPSGTSKNKTEVICQRIYTHGQNILNCSQLSQTVKF